jgi:hypothetical protein
MDLKNTEVTARKTTESIKRIASWKQTGERGEVKLGRKVFLQNISILKCIWKKKMYLRDSDITPPDQYTSISDFSPTTIS